LQDDFDAAVRATSIRAPLAREANPNFKPFEGAPGPTALRVDKRVKNNKKVKRTEIETANQRVGSRVPLENPRVKTAVKRILANHEQPVYRNLQVRSINKCTERGKDDPLIWVRVKDEGAHYCHNVKRDHTSDFVYFGITRDGIFQKCFSQQCRNYKGQCFAIQTKDVDLLFPSNKRKQDDTYKNQECYISEYEWFLRKEATK
jgi:hypothetical protein